MQISKSWKASWKALPLFIGIRKCQWQHLYIDHMMHNSAQTIGLDPKSHSCRGKGRNRFSCSFLMLQSPYCSSKILRAGTTPQPDPKNWAEGCCWKHQSQFFSHSPRQGAYINESLWGKKICDTFSSILITTFCIISWTVRFALKKA